MEDLSNYEKLKEDAQNFYNNIRKAFSPAWSDALLEYRACVDNK